ncbi:solute carrier family 12 member 8 isoform X1 [Hippoglossus hippoglossus]|uniref:solute carrier family 12 member 8 isoform X1 n=2 Tax=Hippoglossus hippoglossus TaxID=8267 RepID=UPI00148C833B|nr:solute carrier family 12 member 8 isoform X1 [Hippoglossus hippoglossus]XP_034430601.1 solute carrier family 12 member 8 isoform X1 [Hippoglossus hippoglossus]XP_034430602.1 solute carrier family 12 member 8 isoform X1 [Hippoglossus hippoglossus]
MDTLPFGWTVHTGDQKGDDTGLLKEGVIDNTTNTHVHDLFHEDAQGFQQPSQPWWRIKVFVWEPVRFGTWDGVFTTCMINIFGVVLFLRTGYLVGNTGVLLGMLLVSSVVLVALVTVMSGIGVCEHCGIGSGGIYSMISTVLGGRVGGTMGLLYVFGQCSAGAMYITGFSESVAELLGLQTQWAVRGMSAAVLLALLGINLAGVKWIVRIQLLLLAVLAVSTLDFVVGSFTHLDPEHGFIGYSAELLSTNTKPDYTPGENFFTVFGVFFPAATGVMAGFNMSSDLQRPEHNIPVGTLAALFTSWFLYLVFAFLLGAICTREALRYDFLIAEKVSLVGFLFLLGLYVSSLASCMGGLYGAPRILQCIAQERVIPALACLGKGKGPNKTPVAAICLTSLLTMAFIFIGQVNVLAPIVTINFMLTYSFIDYSYFSVVMTFQLQSKEKRDALTLAKRNQRRSAKQSSRPLLQDPLPNYGSGGESPQSKGTLSEFTKDMDRMFPPVSNVDAGAEKSFSLQELSSRGKSRKATAKQTLMDSFGLDLNRNMFSEEEKGEETGSPPPYEEAEVQPGSGEPRAREESQVKNCTKQDLGADHHNHNTGAEGKAEQQSFEIKAMEDSIYAKFSNHWIALIGALSSLVIMFVIQWVYALANIVVALLLYFYIGKTSPGLPIGIAARFSFFTWLKSTLNSICRGKGSPRDEVIVTPSLSGVGLKTRQLTEENADFASRHRYHQSSFIVSDKMVQPPSLR